jgi:hypothetical protein
MICWGEQNVKEVAIFLAGETTKNSLQNFFKKVRWSIEIGEECIVY